MIARIAGQIVEVNEGVLLLRTGGGLTFEILIPAADTWRWGNLVGEPAELFTLPFFEAPGQGTTLIPRLVGFATAADRDFFVLFTKTRGIGYRKALRAMVAPAEQIATAIAGRDISWLKTLPEIGKRTAETIVAELHGRINDFLLQAGADLARSRAEATPPSASETTIGASAELASDELSTKRGPKRSTRSKKAPAAVSTSETKPAAAAPVPAEAVTTGGRGGASVSSRYADARDAVVALVRMGESRPVAQALMDRVLSEFPNISGAEELITVALRLRAQS